MKLCNWLIRLVIFVSLPMRGEWIEITIAAQNFREVRSLPMRGEWIEIINQTSESITISASLPMRGEWIEISATRWSPEKTVVSPHAGRVD